MSASLEKLLRDARIDLILARIEKDPSIIEELIKFLDAEIRSVRFNSILILGELGQKSANSVFKLQECLEDNDWSICREAARTLGKIGNLAEKSVPELSKLLKNEEVSIRKEAAIALGKIGYGTEESISGLINALKDINEDVRTAAAEALGYIGSDASKTISDLMLCLKDTNWEVRTAAAKAIGEIGRESVKTIPTLIKALEDKDWRVRFRVITTLSQIGQDSIPNLLNALNHKDPTVRMGAIEALGEMKIADFKIIEKLSLLLEDRVEGVRGKAADALRSIGKESVPVMIKAIEKSPSKMKKVIISAIGGMGSEGKEAIPPLGEMLIVSEGDLEDIKNQFISSMFQDKLKRIIMTFIKDPLSIKASIRVQTARGLGRIGQESKDAVDILRHALFDPKKIVRREALLALGNIGSSAANAIPEIIESLEDKTPDVRWRASEALGKIGESSPEVISALEKLIYDEFDLVSDSANNAIDILTE